MMEPDTMTTKIDRDGGRAEKLSAFHLYGLRILFLLMAVFLLGTIGPLSPSPSPAPTAGVSRALLVALGIMAAIGVVYPRQMLPIMAFELLWKLLWLACIGLPLWWAGRLDPSNAATFKELTIGVGLVLIVFPYRYALGRYFR